MSKNMHQFWLQHVHSFFVSVRFLFATATALTNAIGTVYLIGKDLSYTEIGVVWSVTLFFSTVLDFPTGNFADIYGRRLTFASGVISVGAGNLIFGVGDSLWVFYVAAFFVGFGSAQMSGALSSWVVDEQIKQNKRDTVGKIFGDGSAAASMGGVIGGILIGVFFKGPLEVLYFSSGFLLILTGAFVFVSVPENYGKPTSRWIGLPREVMTYFIHSFPLVILSAALVLMFACFTVFLFIWQPLAVDLGMQKGSLGYLYSVFMGGSTAGAFLMGRLKRVRENVALLVCFLVSAAGFLVISQRIGMYGLVCGLVLFAFGYGGFIPVLYAWSNTFIPSSIRASTSSLVGTIGTGGIIVLQVVMGAFVETYGLGAAAWCAVGFAFAGGGALIVLYQKQQRNDSLGKK